MAHVGDIPVRADLATFSRLELASAAVKDFLRIGDEKERKRWLLDRLESPDDMVRSLAIALLDVRPLVDEELELALIREARCESVLANQALRALMRYPVEDYFDVVPELLDCADRENAWAAKQVVEWARMCCPDIERLRDRKTRLEEVAEVKACLRESRISAVNPFVKPPPRRLMCQEKRDRELEERRRQAEERRKRMAPR